MDKVQVEILGISSSASNGAYALILRETAGLRRIPIIIGANEAQAIALELEGIKPPRPLTHDLVTNIIQLLGGSVAEVRIHELREGTFYATIVLSDDQEIDSRPSDAIAIAIRFAANIFVTESVMAEAGFLPEEGEDDSGDGMDDDEDDKPIEERMAPKPETPSQSKVMSPLDTLNKQLDDAIKKEEYEKAAKLRDDIQKLMKAQRQTKT